MKYAQQTTVSVERSRGEIESILIKYGASGFLYGWQKESAVLAFEMKSRRIKFILPMPDRNDEKFWKTPARRKQRNPDEAYKEWEQSCRQKWRALLLAVKAKLECVESGISSFEEEFMAHIVLPDGKTISEWMTPQIHAAYQSGKMPKLLPELT